MACINKKLTRAKFSPLPCLAFALLRLTDSISKQGYIRCGMSYLGRLERELRELALNPSPGVSAWIASSLTSSSSSSSSSSNSLLSSGGGVVSSNYGEQVAKAINEDGTLHLDAQIEGPDDSPFEGGLFRLSITLSSKYPIEPPRALFVTPVYHPNIDGDGRICLDLLKPQPQGGWSPTININTLLLSIRLLLGSPNASDGLVPDITELYKTNRATWFKTAKDMTQKYAKDQSISGTKRSIGDSISSSSNSNSNSGINNNVNGGSSDSSNIKIAASSSSSSLSQPSAENESAKTAVVGHSNENENENDVADVGDDGDFEEEEVTYLSNSEDEEGGVDGTIASKRSRSN